MDAKAKAVRILSVRFSKPGSPVAMYARVISVSRSNKLLHNVVRNCGSRKLSCTCEHAVLGGNPNCKHVRAVRSRIKSMRNS